ncbi:hypothetical protein EMCG_04304 [[Emmonsia] crescens]|uniref:Uncharacterized protein n=1 Tax=[Emmonsia] crescens TaxID=73230 RepID=A0A0G2J7N7_9EURO|nr:hypothetical protein EMCG_04304 [Emmonsia crescens UAMH 3008]
MDQSDKALETFKTMNPHHYERFSKVVCWLIPHLVKNCCVGDYVHEIQKQMEDGLFEIGQKAILGTLVQHFTRYRGHLQDGERDMLIFYFEGYLS